MDPEGTGLTPAADRNLDTVHTIHAAEMRLCLPSSTQQRFLHSTLRHFPQAGQSATGGSQIAHVMTAGYLYVSSPASSLWHADAARRQSCCNMSQAFKPLGVPMIAVAAASSMYSTTMQ